MSGTKIDMEALKETLLNDFKQAHAIQQDVMDSEYLQKTLGYSEVTRAARSILLEAIGKKAEIVTALTAIEREQRESAAQKRAEERMYPQLNKEKHNG